MKTLFFLFISILLPAAGLAQLPEEGTPYEYSSAEFCTETEITIEAPAGTLSGTLALPKEGKGPFPALLLLNGSGAQDRDCTIGSYKPFRTIAEALAQKGYATLRLDDRTMGASIAPEGYYGIEQLYADAVTAMQWLAERPETAPGEIGLLGHSMGGALALLMAAENPETVKCVVALAAPAVPGKELMVRQNELLLNALGQTLSEENHEALVKIFDAVITGSPEKISEVVEKYGIMAGMNPLSMPAQIKVLSSPEYIEMVSLDYSNWLPDVHCPVLALYSEWDIQIDPQANIVSIKREIPTATAAVIPCTNHLFQKSASRDASLNYMVPGSIFSPEALQQIADFLKINL